MQGGIRTMLSHRKVLKSSVLQHVRLVNPVMFPRYESTASACMEEHVFESTTISDMQKAKGKGADGSWLNCTTNDTVNDVVKSSKKILDASFERLPFHGLGKELSANWGKSLGYQLISRGYLTEAKRDGYNCVSSKGVQFEPVLNEMSGDEEQRIVADKVGQSNGLVPLEYEGLSEAQLHKKPFEERMKIAMPCGTLFGIWNIDGANQMNAMSVSDISLKSSTLLLTLALFWHTNEGIKEILADYVHQETTRAWISVLFRLFFLIVIKDLFFLL